MLEIKITHKNNILTQKNINKAIDYATHTNGCQIKFVNIKYIDTECAIYTLVCTGKHYYMLENDKNKVIAEFSTTWYNKLNEVHRIDTTNHLDSYVVSSFCAEYLKRGLK